jgi:hypothetical protein
MVQRLSELGIAYRGSPIIEGPGKRYFDDSLRGGNGILSRFLLMVGRGSEPSIQEAATQLCAHFSDVVELRPSGGLSGLTLVRPDGYIAYDTHNRDGIAALGSVRSLLERQTNFAD